MSAYFHHNGWQVYTNTKMIKKNNILRNYMTQKKNASIHFAFFPFIFCWIKRNSDMLPSWCFIWVNIRTNGHLSHTLCTDQRNIYSMEKRKRLYVCTAFHLEPKVGDGLFLSDIIDYFHRGGRVVDTLRHEMRKRITT